MIKDCPKVKEYEETLGCSSDEESSAISKGASLKGPGRPREELAGECVGSILPKLGGERQKIN